MTELKDKLIELLEEKPLTVFEMANGLGMNNTSMITDILPELENDKKVGEVSMKKCYKPDGSAFYLAQYGLIDKNNLIPS